MKGKKLLCIVLSLAAACSLLLVRDSTAWFDTQTATSPSSLIVVDKMAFSFDGTLGSYLEYPSGATHAGDPYLVTEQNLIVTNGGKITVTNYSTIPTEARFKITYDARIENTTTTVERTYTGSATDSLSATIDPRWVLNSSDSYYYFNWSDSVVGFPAASGTPEPVDAITNIMYLDELFRVDPQSGELVTLPGGGYDDILHQSDYFPAGGDPFSGSVHIIFEAKQKDYVDWQTITDWATS